MAGAFSHMAIVGEAKAKFPAEEIFGNILRDHSQFLTLGSISPDIPYLSHLSFTEGTTWADIMHYYNTNMIVLNALHSLSVAKEKKKIWECQLAWLLGYVSHLVIDATIHPIVESIVGPYTDKDTNKEHCLCEMVQDVMIFKEVMGIELSATEYTNLLRACQTSDEFHKVAEFWKSHAMVYCPMADEFSPETVISSYLDEIDTAEGGNALAKAVRHFGFDYVYRTHEDLVNNDQDLVSKYYKEIKLPDGTTGSFREAGFNYAVKNLESVWSKINRLLFTTENIFEIVPNWNLDTGVDQDTGIRTYWG